MHLGPGRRQNGYVTAATPPPGGALLGDDFHWSPWTPDEVATLLAGVTTRWYVVAGWAIDLFLGEETRPHEDIEIGVPTGGFAEIRRTLGDYQVFVIGSEEEGPGMRWPLESSAFDDHFQTWFIDPFTGDYRLDVFRDPHEGDTWLCRRNHTIQRPYDELVRYSAGGVPYMTPEVALLFKAKHTRKKDQADFRSVRPYLDDDQVQWLRTNLALLHPGHQWLDDL